HQLDAALVEFRLQLRENAEFGGADRREILRVREQQCPIGADPVVEFDLALGGLGFEIRGECANLECHGSTSCHSSYRGISDREYRWSRGGSEPPGKKGDILLRKAELLASSFDPRPCDEKTTGEFTGEFKGPIAPIL